jgi:hypothetical protein
MLQLTNSFDRGAAVGHVHGLAMTGIGQFLGSGAPDHRQKAPREAPRKNTKERARIKPNPLRICGLL